MESHESCREHLQLLLKVVDLLLGPLGPLVPPDTVSLHGGQFPGDVLVLALRVPQRHLPEI